MKRSRRIGWVREVSILLPLVTLLLVLVMAQQMVERRRLGAERLMEVVILARFA